MGCLDLEEMEGQWPESEAMPSRASYKFENADEVEPEQLSWLIKNVLPKVGVVFLAGPSGSGKSFLALEMASNVALGLPTLGQPSLQSSVLYLAAEAPNGIKLRMKALRGAVGIWNGRLHLLGMPVALSQEEEIALLQGEIRRSFEQGIGLIVIDTFSASMPGSDENNSADMSRVIASLQKLAAAFQTCILVVAHTGKEHAKGVRGWSGLHANADAVFILNDPATDGTRGGLIAKLKDGESGQAFSFHLELRTVGYDDDQDPITSCLVKDLAKCAKKETSTQNKKGQDAQLIVRVLKSLLAEAGVASGGRLDGRVRVPELREAVFRAGLAADSEPTSDSDPNFKKWADARRHRWSRAYEMLVGQNRIIVEDGWVRGTD